MRVKLTGGALSTIRKPEPYSARVSCCQIANALVASPRVGGLKVRTQESWRASLVRSRRIWRVRIGMGRWKSKTRTRHGLFFVSFLFFVRNFEGFNLPCSRSRYRQWQTSARANFVLKLAWFDVETGVSDLPAIVRTNGELPVASVVAQASDILPADIFFAS